MVFSSLTFLFVFLPVTLLGYRLLPQRLRIGFLLLASLIFYAWGEPLYVFLMAGSILVNWLLGFQVAKDGPRKKAFLALSIVLNLLLLLIFKYTGLLWDTVKGLFPAPLSEKTVAIRLPIGISFFTFQIMSYVIDVYRGKAKAQKNPILFGAYVSMFPQLIAGPIVRYVDIEAQLDQPDLSLEGFSQGVGLFVVGLGKKVLLANGVAALWRELSAAPAQSGVLAAWVGLVAYTFQIYFDFSGYSDMAIGLGRLLGFNFRENFLWPYAATSIRDFWRRWHISLSLWFRDYLYIPLGGSRCGKARTCLNGLVVFTLCGMWHGAGVLFALWGLWHGLLLSVERLVAPPQPKGAPVQHHSVAVSLARFLFSHAYALAAIAFGWVFFRSATLGAAGVILKSLTGLAPLSREARVLWLDCTPLFQGAILLGAILSLPVVPILRRGLRRILSGDVAWTLESLAATVLGAFAVIFLVAGTRQSFLYFQF